MFHVDLKKASVALAASRLDDAFEVLTTSKERTHRDAQALISQLADRFVQRAQQHLAENRLQDAEHDAGRAHELAGNGVEIAQLLAAVNAAQQKINAERFGRDQVLNEVRQQAEVGQFSLGQRLLKDMPQNNVSERGIEAKKQTEQLLDQQRQIIEHTIQQVSDAAKNNAYQAVVTKIRTLNDGQQRHPQIAKLKDAAIQSICVDATKAISDGRIDKAISAFESIQDWKHPAIDELSKLLSCCSTINTAITQQNFLTAETNLRLLNQLTHAKWISTALKHVQAITEQLKELQSGPLGLFAAFDKTLIETPSAQPPAKARLAGNLPPIPQANSNRLSNGRILQVDGIGSLLLQTQDVVSIGTASHSKPVDIGLLTDGQIEPVVIRRTAEDYFAESAVPFTVNGRTANRHLLQSGDSIEIGARARLKFSQPVAASSSAVLTVSAAKLQRRDIRHIILLSDSLLMGANGCHLKLPDITTPVLLHRSGSDLAVRQLGQESHALQVGSPISIQHIRFALADQQTMS